MLLPAESFPSVIRHQMQEPDQTSVLFVSAATWVLLWFVMFYFLSWTYPKWSRVFAPSTKPHENNRFHCARNILGIVHATIVGLTSFIVLLVYVGAPPSAKFSNTDNIATCLPSSSDSGAEGYGNTQQTIALVGLMFTTFTVADLIVGFIHRMITLDYVVHHISFIAAGVLIRGNCVLPFNAAALMSMEVSTPFLNWMIFLRHRGNSYKSQVVISGVLFLVTYLVFRVILNCYATAVLFVFVIRGNEMPKTMASWQAHLLLVAVGMGAFVQVYWLPKIWESFGGRIKALIYGQECNVTDEETEPAETRTLLLRPDVKASRHSLG